MFTQETGRTQYYGGAVNGPLNSFYLISMEGLIPAFAD